MSRGSGALRKHFAYLTASQNIILSDFDVEPGFSEFDDFLRFEVEDPADFNWEEDGPLILEGGVASGDSGGPDFLADTIIGVHSFGFGVLDGAADSSFTDIAGSVSTVPWAAWLDSVIAGNGTLGEIADTLTGSSGTALFLEEVADELTRINTEAFLDWVAVAYPQRTIGTAPGARGYMLGLAPANTVIPEPGTLGLLGLGVLVLLRRRRA